MGNVATRRASRYWTKEEDDALAQAVRRAGDENPINWHTVAAEVATRNNKECRKRWVYALSAQSSKGSWDDNEDRLLIEAVRKHGFKWALVSDDVGSRKPDQCSRRWHETLNPKISHDRWTLLEDRLLKEAVDNCGRKWTEIVERFFPNRTPISTKNRYDQLYGDSGSTSFNAFEDGSMPDEFSPPGSSGSHMTKTWPVLDNGQRRSHQDHANQPQRETSSANRPALSQGIAPRATSNSASAFTSSRSSDQWTMSMPMDLSLNSSAMGYSAYSSSPMLQQYNGIDLQPKGYSIPHASPILPQQAGSPSLGAHQNQWPASVHSTTLTAPSIARASFDGSHHTLPGVSHNQLGFSGSMQHRDGNIRTGRDDTRPSTGRQKKPF